MSKQPKFTIGSIFMDGITTKKPSEIKELLSATAWGATESNYPRTLTPEERAEASKKLAESAIRLKQIQDEKKEVMGEFKEKIKDETAIYNNFLSQSQYGSVNVEGTLYMIDDQELGLMYLFDERGVCVNTRALLPEERQTRIRSIGKGTGTNGE